MALRHRLEMESKASSDIRGQGLLKGETAEVIGLKAIALANYASGLDEAFSRDGDEFVQWLMEVSDGG